MQIVKPILSLLACLALSWQVQFDPAKRANDLENERMSRVSAALRAGKSGDIDKIEAELATKAAADLKTHDSSNIDAKQAAGWAQLYKVAKDFKTERALLGRYIGAVPGDFGARLEYMMSCFELNDGADLNRMLFDTKPGVGPNGWTLASYMGGTFHYAIRESLGPEGAIKALDYTGQFIPKVPFQSDEARKSSGWARRQLADAKASYLAELGRTREAVAVVDEALKTLDPDVYRLAALNEARRRYEMIGKPIPSLPTTRTHGVYKGLDACKGKVVILDFTAHWCHACIASLPSLEKLYRDLHSKGLEIYSVTTFYGHFAGERATQRDMPQDEEYAKMPAWMKQHGISWPMLYVTGQTMKDFGVSGIPQVMLIDANGVLKSIDLGFSDAKFKRFRDQVEAELERRSP